MRRSYCLGQGIESGKEATGWGQRGRCRSTPVMRPSLRQDARFRSRRHVEAQMHDAVLRLLCGTLQLGGSSGRAAPYIGCEIGKITRDF